jgi:bifunctional polynucleotide phosphatase/kinase
MNLKTQLSIILRQLDLPISFYGASGQDKYRKPRVGMWQELLEDYDLQADGAVDLAQSFYVGDAAGRIKTGKRKKDFATSDRELAMNLGIEFKTPEQFFLQAESEAYSHDFNPINYLSGTITGPVAPFAKKHEQELVVFCGSPGAGKSSWYWKNLQPLGYERINQDTLKTVSDVG